MQDCFVMFCYYSLYIGLSLFYCVIIRDFLNKPSPSFSKVFGCFYNSELKSAVKYIE